jgi:hypothetical protein
MTVDEIWESWTPNEQNNARYFTKSAAFSPRPREGLRKLIGGRCSLNEMLRYIRSDQMTDHVES